MLRHRRFQRRFISAHDLGDLLSVLEEQERRHGAHAELLGQVGDVVDVELEEACGGVLVRQLDHFRCNDFTGAAPGGEAVDYQQGGIGEGIGIFGFAKEKRGRRVSWLVFVMGERGDLRWVVGG